MNLKCIVISAISVVLVNYSSAQIEAKINPIGALFGNFDLSGEYIVSDDMGVELTISLITGNATGLSSGEVDVSKSGFGTLLYGKYYFGPDLGGDRLYAGLYLRQRGIEYKGEDDNSVYASFKRNIVAVGIGTGYKYVSDKNVLIELGFGVGRALSESNTWSDSNNEGEAFPSIGLDGFVRLSIGYRF